MAFVLLPLLALENGNTRPATRQRWPVPVSVAALPLPDGQRLADVVPGAWPDPCQAAGGHGPPPGPRSWRLRFIDGGAFLK